MHIYHIENFKHGHEFQGEQEGRAERRTYAVIAVTLVVMIIEILAGRIFGSMALLADGWHMGTHAAALGITAFAYVYARRHAKDPVYTFGTGKVGVLGGFASAVFLGVVALMMLWESSRRLLSPVEIRFNEAIGVACIGLAVNLVCAYLLTGRRHTHGNEPHDHNLRAAYFHVLADALTSFLAIIALLSGKSFGLVWMDPVMGIVGSLIIARWSYGLIRDTSKILLDGEANADLTLAIRRKIETRGHNRVSDLHVWRIGPHHHAATITILTHHPESPEHYKALLSEFDELSHITVEVHPFSDPCCLCDTEGTNA